jgi:DNA primase
MKKIKSQLETKETEELAKAVKQDLEQEDPEKDVEETLARSRRNDRNSCD